MTETGAAVALPANATREARLGCLDPIAAMAAELTEPDLLTLAGRSSYCGPSHAQGLSLSRFGIHRPDLQRILSSTPDYISGIGSSISPRRGGTESAGGRSAASKTRSFGADLRCTDSQRIESSRD
jgi:hypothetical protein